MDDITNEELKEYNKKIKELSDQLNVSLDYLNQETVSDTDLKEIKKIYHKIVKIIHPDVLKNNLELKDLWQDTQDAYVANNLDRLKEIYDLVLVKVVKKDDAESLKLQIEKLKDQIESVQSEIEELKKNQFLEKEEMLLNDDLVEIELKPILERIEELKENHKALLKVKSHYEINMQES
ncbi:MAG: hypothetical protein PHH04_00925 [Thomasclavelia sp.]|nr:hypothetical protein [Thomasclavelia sp.]